MRHRVCRLSLVACLTAAAAGAQVFDGSEFRVNETTAFDQTDAAAAADAAGRFVVTWVSAYQDGSDRGIFGQRFGASGAKLGAEFAVNSHVTGRQQAPAVAMDPAGNFVVVWEGVGPGENYTYGVFGQRFDATGTRLGVEFHVNEYTPNGQFRPAVAVDPSGRFIVAWQSLAQDTFGASGIYARRYDASGDAVGGEFLVNQTTAGDQAHPGVAVDEDGRFLVVWSGPPITPVFGNSSDIWARLYDAGGVAQTGEFVVNSVTYDAQLYPVVAAGGDQFVVAWRTPDVPGFFLGGVAARRVSSGAVPLDADFIVNDYTTGAQAAPSIGIDPSGNFTIAWHSQPGQDGSQHGIFARRYTAAGAPASGEFQVNTFTTGAQSDPAVTARGPNRYLVAWQSVQDGSGSGVYAQAVVSDVIFKNGFE
jgi:hypothetical protein